MATNGRDKDYVLQTCKAQNIKFIRLWFTDILGSRGSPGSMRAT